MRYTSTWNLKAKSSFLWFPPWSNGFPELWKNWKLCSLHLDSVVIVFVPVSKQLLEISLAGLKMVFWWVVEFYETHHIAI